MEKKESSKYFKIGSTAVGVVIVSLLCFFVIDRFPSIMSSARGFLQILAPFVYGAAIAYLLSPACGRIEKQLLRLFAVKGEERFKKLASMLSILLSLLSMLFVLWILLLMVLPQLCRSIIGIAYALPGQIQSVDRWLHGLLENQPELQDYWDTFSAQAVTKLEKWMQTELLPTAQSLLTGLGGQVMGVLNVFKNLFLGIIVSIYLLASRKKFAAQARMALWGIFPKRWAEGIEIEVHYADRMFSGFLIGKLVDSAIIGGICFLFTLLMRFESALLISVIVGVTNIIPFFGPYIGAVPCIILLLLENPLHALYFTVFIIILQQVDGNIIGPKILGDSTGLSGFCVLFSILLFSGIWGFFGMIVGVPLFAVIYDMIRKLIFFLLEKRGNQKLMLDYEREFGELSELEETDGRGASMNDAQARSEQE